MGETRVNIKVCGPKKCRELKDVLVDTGAITSTISKDVAEEIKPIMLGYKDFRTVNGKVKYPFGVAKIGFLGEEHYSPIVVVEDLNVVGTMTLELMRFKVNPSTMRLEKIHELPRL